MNLGRDDRTRRSERVGESLTWLCGGALAFNLLMIVAVIGFIGYRGLDYFWQGRVALCRLEDGRRLLGEISGREERPPTPGKTLEMTGRLQLRVGNRDVTGAGFVWIDDDQIAEISYPEDALLLERLEWGHFYGRAVELRRGDEVLARGPDEVWRAFGPLHEEKVARREAIERLERGEIGDINFEIERLRLAGKRLARRDLSPDERALQEAAIAHETKEREAQYQVLADRLFEERESLAEEQLVMETADGERNAIAVGEIVRAVRPNAMSLLDRAGLYLGRVREFVWDDPRESNTEGGIFPAIFGTVLMVFIMSIAVVPLGVLAALYLREYAKQGVLVRTVRIAVNNLAGVPSIVFGVFGLGFFVYLVGGSIDRLFYPDALPTPTYGTGGILWASLTLALLTVPVVIVATEEGLAAVPRGTREGSLALGATKFETIRRVVLPAAAPGILTGMILAMARAAGEVAPLMIVGMVKLAPTLPLDHHFPFVHLERKFMHLGFHIYDVGFQSPNVEATTPLVFATALLLVLVVTLMNVAAIVVRNRLRRKYASSAI
ncbi:MAG: phosphate ABC transporter permease PstA [Deltaproteobacteria bacterium]|nr:phosphate ABC transporter permease PstA [Deltaproteobacteria bacterium]